MALFRKAGSMLGRSVTNHISREVSFTEPSIFQAVRWMSSSKLFIGGLSYETDDTSLREAFGKYGEVVDGRVIYDRETSRSRGFGFITYSSVDEASAAIQAMDQKELQGRSIRVDYANDRARGGGGGGYGGGGGGYGSSGGYGGGGGYGSSGGYSGGGGGYNSGGNYGSGSGGYNSGSSNYGSHDQAFSGGDSIPASSGFDEPLDGNYADRRN